MSMSHRERALTALNHREPDRVPLDLGAGLATTITTDAYIRLREYLKLPPTVPVDHRSRSLTVVPDDDVLELFDIDFRGVPWRGAPDMAVETLPDGSYVDEWGVKWSAPPHGGHYIDVDSPFRHVAEPTLDLLKKHDWPKRDTKRRLKGLRDTFVEMREKSDCALIFNTYLRIGHFSQWLRGYDNWLADLVSYPEFADALMQKVMEIDIEIVSDALDEIGDLCDVVCFSDDMGFQNRPIMSPEMYRKLMKPKHQQLVAAMRAKTKAKIYWHSDGALVPLLPDMMDVGPDILNPIQISATGMSDTAMLKRVYGDRLTFWGAIDTHDVMNNGTVDDVRAEVKRRIKDLAPGGGYVLAAVHNMQSDVPPQNVVAMYEAAREFGRYPVAV